MNTESYIFTRGSATRENTTFGVHSVKQKSIFFSFMNTESNIFTSGFATRENTTFGVHALK